MNYNFDRIHAVDEAKKKSARADMKQHADKLIQGFEKLNDSHAKRAVWELVQNACDLTDHCEIVIDFSNNGFSFSHNGNPFNSETLISLIKQVSSKEVDSSDDVGQFGTGFITTHSFGKIINLNSILQEGEFCIEVADYKINRHAKNSEELVEKLVDQELMVYQLISKGDILENPEIKTTFSYLSDYPQDKENIKQAEANLHHYIPLVMALNDSLKSVKVISTDETVTLYKKDKEESVNDIIKIPVLKNGTSINVFCLRSADESIQVILPLSEINITKSIDDSIAKLFLFFPLIGTEKWGCNFIIHSKLFAPTEQRDGIHIKSKNEQTQQKEIGNQRLIDEASKIIFDFIKRFAESVSDPINLAHINFDSKTNTALTNDYFKELKQKWFSKFNVIKLVETSNGRKKPYEILFISQGLLSDLTYYDSIYSIIEMFWKNRVPNKDVALKWTVIVNEWEDKSIQFITADMVVQKIQEEGNLAKFNDEKILHSLYEYLVKYNDIKVFEDHKLLPNIKNELVKKGVLKRPVNIDEAYIAISDILIPEVPKKYIKNSFYLGLEYSNYNRKNLSEDFNTRIISATKELSSESVQKIDIAFRNGMISLCSIYSTEASQSTRKQILPKVCSFYGVEYKEQIIPNVEDDKFDYDYTPFRGLIKIFLIDIVRKSKKESGWVEQELEFLRTCLSILTSYKDLKDIIESVPVFPNQKYELCNQVSLKKEKHYPSSEADRNFLKDIFRDLIHDVRKDLVLNDFAAFLFHNNEQTGLELAGKLELAFKTHGTYEDITNHQNKGVIFQIVQRLTNNKEWATYFPTLEDKKAIIMMAKISDPAVKDDLFSIIGLEDKTKIALLGRLALDPQLERIISLGTKALEEEKKNNADFQFKHEIGKHIENLIKQKLGKDLGKFLVQVQDVQNGQDIVIKKKNEAGAESDEVYYVEVKSRWNSDSSIMMSKNQFTNAARNKDKYSLCCVEMSDYKIGQSERYKVEDVNIIFDRIKIINTIGIEIEPLIDGIFLAKDIENEITITGDYKATIPQRLIKDGSNISEFVSYLILKLNLV